MAPLHGPHPVSAQMQVKLPVKLARELSLQPGDEFYWRRSDDDPAVLQLVPSEVVERRYGLGERDEAARRASAQPLVADESLASRSSEEGIVLEYDPAAAEAGAQRSEHPGRSGGAPAARPAP